jgi:hypothetical protein
MASLQIRGIATSRSGSPVLVVGEAWEATTFGAWRNKGVTCASEDEDVIVGRGGGTEMMISFPLHFPPFIFQVKKLGFIWFLHHNFSLLL